MEIAFFLHQGMQAIVVVVRPCNTFSFVLVQPPSCFLMVNARQGGEMVRHREEQGETKDERKGGLSSKV